MIEAIQERPGLLYVVATLLPLASFVVLLLMGMLRAALRAQREAGGLGQTLYEALGGDSSGKGPAFVATSAIGLAFVCVLVGFVFFLDNGHRLEDLKQEIAATEAELKKVERDIDFTGVDDKDTLKKLNLERVGLERALRDARNEVHERHEKFRGSIIWAALTTQSKRLDDGEKPADKDLAKEPGHEDEEAQYAYGLGLRDPEKGGTRLGDAERGTRLTLGFNIDHLAAIMFLMVTLVATLIHVFSIGYMGDELAPVVEDHQVPTAGGHLRRRGRFSRFFMYLSLFCFSMLNLVLADNFFQVFVSWELVGICSYLLIGHSYERTSASNAANKAFITNRVGDAGFIIGMLILWTYVGTFSFDGIFARLRSPERDSHNPLEYAGQIVRGEIVDEKVGKDGRLRRRIEIGKPSDAASLTTQAMLFPRKQPGHFHGAGPGGDKKLWTFDDPEPREYGAMPYWLLVAAGLGIFLGCVGKSAQFPLQVWLPDAMEGPTPVSALIHAATMVAAGVYLVGRVYPLFTPEAQLVIAYTGAITLFIAATIAIVQTDIKKVLAYSTVSQLGYMMLGLGVGGWVAGLFHLITHAFFKALLFLCSGAVIYNCHHEQDMTKMGGLYPKMKITAITMLMGVLAIAGTPLFSGWYSKDAILVDAFGFVRVPSQQQHLLLFLLPLLTAGITTFYMFRMWYLTFAGKPRDQHIYEHAHEAPHVMTVPLIILAFFSVVVAWGWPMWDPEASWLEHQIHHSQPRAIRADFGNRLDLEGVLPAGTPLRDQRQLAHEYHLLVGNLTLLVVLLAFAFATLVYYYGVLDPAEAKEQFPAVHRFLWHKWFFDELYSVLLVRPALVASRFFRAFDMYVIDGFIDWLGRFTARFAFFNGAVDRGVVDGSVNLLANVFYGVGARLRGVQTGYLRSYVLFLALAAVAIWALVMLFFNPTAAGGGK